MLTTSLMPIQKAKRLFELSHSAPGGFGARISWNCCTWSTMDLRGRGVPFWLSLTGEWRDV